MKHLLTILLLLPLVAFGQVEVRRYATMTELLSANPNAFAVAGRATVVVTGRTNFYDGWSRVLSYSSSDTNAADNSTIFSPSNTNFPGRYRLLYLENATNSSVRAGILPPYGYNAIWINGAWVSITNLFAAGTNMQLTATSNRLTIAMTNLAGVSGNPLIRTVDGLTFTNLDLVSNGDLYWSVPDFTNLYAQLYPNTVDYDEIQQVSGQRLLGNPSGSAANVSEISIGANLALSGGGVLSALVPAGTNSFQIGVDGVLVNTPNLTDSSEINSSASGTNITFSLLSSSVALAKLESISASRLVGRGSSGSGSPEQITLGSGLSLSGTTLNPAVSSFSANGTAISTPNILNAAEISASISALTNVYMSLNAGSVGFSKIQDVASGTLVGRGASGTGSVSQITLGTGLALTTNGVLSATGTNTTLVRVGGTSVTGPNFLDSTEMDWSIDLSTNISIDLFPASVVFSKLQSISTSRLLGRSTSGSGAIEQIQIGSGLSLSSGTLSASGGGGTSVYVDGVSVTNPNFADAATTGLFDVTSGTNVTIRLPDRDFGSVTVSGSGTTISYDTGSISSNHIASGQVSQDKLGTSGTATSTNFLAGDYAWKQVTTNMIPGLNAILATIGTGGSGSTTSNVVQRTGWGLFLTGASSISNDTTNGVVEAISHQAGDSITEMVVNVTLTARTSTNYLVSFEIYNTNDLDTEGPASVNISDKTTTGFKIQASRSSSGAQPNGFWFRFWITEGVDVGSGGGGGGGSGSVTSVAASTTVSGLGISGSPITTSGTLSLTGVVGVASGGTGATNAAAARSNLGVLSSRWLTGFGSPTDYSQGTGSYYVNLDTYQVWEQTDTNTWATIPFFVMGEGVYSYLDQHNIFSASNTFVGAIHAQSGIYGSGASLTNLNGTEIRSGTVSAARIDSAMATDAEVAAGYQPLDADLTAMAAGTAVATAQTNAVSVGAPTLYVGSTNVAAAVALKAPISGPSFTGTATNTGSFGAPTLYVGSTNVAVAIAAKAPIASPAFTTSATIGGTNVLDYAATHLTEAEASALYQRTNSILTALQGLTGGTAGRIVTSTGSGTFALSNQVSHIGVNVRDYGAAGDGATDDTTALTSALTNSVVFFPPGTYLTTTLYPTGGIIYGVGNLSIIKARTNLTTGHLIDTRSNICTIRNLRLDTSDTTNYSGTSALGPRSGIKLWAEGNAVVENVHISNFSGYGVFVGGIDSIIDRPNRAMLSGLYITNCQTGIWMGDTNQAEYCSVVRNHIKGCRKGIQCDSANVLVSENNLTDCQYGIWSYPLNARSHSLYANNIINHSFLRFQNCQTGANVIGNMMLGSTSIDLYTGCNGVMVTGNFFENTWVTDNSGPNFVIGNQSYSTPVFYAGSSKTVARNNWARTGKFIAEAAVEPYAATITPDAIYSTSWKITLTGSPTLNIPSNAVDGETYTFQFLQDATGGRAVTLSTNYVLPTGMSALTITTNAGKWSTFTGIYSTNTSKVHVLTSVGGF